MARIRSFAGLAILSLCAEAVYGHVAPFHESMYCLNGYQTAVDLNSYAIVFPLYELEFNQWWFHGSAESDVNEQCMDYPPAEGKFLDIPAGGSFMVEIASNRAKTTTSYNGRDTSKWPDGNNYPDDYHNEDCIISPNLHTQDRRRAAGTAFAISYESDIRKVTPENLVVFSVTYNTPWLRETWYQVPAALPACPPGGCICAWGWVPDGCGQPNMYHQAFKCRVTGATSTTAVGKPKAPVWCENEPQKCVQGPKQMIYWHQKTGNNVFTDGFDSKGKEKSPTYNKVMGFNDGAQNDIFVGAPSTGGGYNPSNPVPPHPVTNNNSGNRAPTTPSNAPPPVDNNDNSNSGTGNSNSGNSNSGNGNNSNNNSGNNSGNSNNSNNNSGNSNSNANSNANTDTPGTSTSPSPNTLNKPQTQRPTCNNRRRRRNAEKREEDRKREEGGGVNVSKRAGTVHRRRGSNHGVTFEA